MDCQPFREALSAMLDGEEPGLGPDAVRLHLAGCDACRRWSNDAATLAAAVPLLASAEAPDLTQAVLAQIPPAASGPLPLDHGLRPWRLTLAVVALLQLSVALPATLMGTESGSESHLALELGSWDVALAIGFLFAAWRPSRAWGMLPLVAALVACLAATTVVGVAAGQASVLRESGHVLELLGLPLLWVLARHSRAAVAPLRPA